MEEVNEAQAQKLKADADAAKALNDAQVKKLEAEATVAKELNDAQTRKVRAEECSARMKAVIDTVPVSDWPAANEAIQKHCDPAYAEREKACADKFKALITSLETLDFNDKNPSETLVTKANEYKAQCPFGLDEQAATKAALERRQAKLDKLKDIVEAAKQKEQAQRSPDATPTPALEAKAQPVVPDLPTPAPDLSVEQGYRPTLEDFACDDPFFASDYVVCHSFELKAARERLRDAYEAALGIEHLAFDILEPGSSIYGRGGRGFKSRRRAQHLRSDGRHPQWCRNQDFCISWRAQSSQWLTACERYLRK